MNKAFGSQSCIFIQGIISRPKKKYGSDKEAITAAKIQNDKPNTIHKYVAYKCHKCGFFHIGKTKKELKHE